MVVSELSVPRSTALGWLRSESRPVVTAEVPDMDHGGVRNPLFLWLPIAGTYRTLCLAPPPEVRAVFEAIRETARGGVKGRERPGNAAVQAAASGA
jgi:hypothetical protein